MVGNNEIAPLGQATLDAERTVKTLRELRRAEIRQRVRGGEGVRAVARAFGISGAAVSKMTSGAGEAV